MSRIGNKPVSIPAGAKVALSGNKLSVEGPLGKLEREFRREVSLTFDEGENLIRVGRNSELRQRGAARSDQGAGSEHAARRHAGL